MRLPVSQLTTIWTLLLTSSVATSYSQTILSEISSESSQVAPPISRSAVSISGSQAVTEGARKLSPFKTTDVDASAIKTKSDQPSSNLLGKLRQFTSSTTGAIRKPSEPSGILSSPVKLPSRNSKRSEPDLATIKQVKVVIEDKNRAAKNGSLSKFMMDVYINGEGNEHHVKSFVVSPGKLIDYPKEGKEPELTPTGTFHPTRMHAEYTSSQFSKKWLGIVELAKMPHSIFFHRGFAIHGSPQTVTGRPLSKGCVRLSKKNAKQFFSWVEAAHKNTGKLHATTIEIRDTQSDYISRYRK